MIEVNYKGSVYAFDETTGDITLDNKKITDGSISVAFRNVDKAVEFIGFVITKKNKILTTSGKLFDVIDRDNLTL